jgi:hypothetical protein
VASPEISVTSKRSPVSRSETAHRVLVVDVDVPAERDPEDREAFAAMDERDRARAVALLERILGNRRTPSSLGTREPQIPQMQ